MPLSKIGNWPTHLRFRQSGSGRVVHDQEKLKSAINYYLTHPNADEEKRRKQMSIDLDREMLHKIVMDFAAALTGREIEFGEELKYPGEKIRNHPLETLEYLRQQKNKSNW